MIIYRDDFDDNFITRAPNAEMFTGVIKRKESPLESIKSTLAGFNLYIRYTYLKRIKTDMLGGASKRALDIVVASIALILLMPLMVTVSALLYFTYGGQIIYSHERIGQGGRRFKCHKFRTMVLNGDEVLARHLAANPQAASEWAANRKLTDDPRVTWIGRALRLSSIDELPQLFNVLAGEMSCVGPRPIVAAEAERYGRSVRHYLRTRPGLTGLWQVHGRSGTTYRMRIALDRQYVAKWSLTLDILILIKTIPAVIRFGESA